MKALIQRVSSAKVEVEVDNEIIGKVGAGLVILLGITEGDTDKDIAILAKKSLNLRIFEDDASKMNLSLLDVKGSILLISQFTLYSDCKKGRRPSFINAAKPEIAIPLYEKFICELRKSGVNVQTGEFRAMMNVSLTNNGPVTIMLESQNGKVV